jgi:hypothetical protein
MASAVRLIQNSVQFGILTPSEDWTFASISSPAIPGGTIKILATGGLIIGGIGSEVTETTFNNAVTFTGTVTLNAVTFNVSPSFGTINATDANLTNATITNLLTVATVSIGSGQTPVSGSPVRLWGNDGTNNSLRTYSLANVVVPTATKLATPRNINGVAFDGTQAISVPGIGLGTVEHLVYYSPSSIPQPGIGARPYLGFTGKTDIDDTTAISGYLAARSLVGDDWRAVGVTVAD